MGINDKESILYKVKHVNSVELTNGMGDHSVSIPIPYAYVHPEPD